MNIQESTELMKKYGICPECGNDKIGGEPSQGSLIIEDEVFTRSCKCGWSVTVDKRIKVIASVTKRLKGTTTGIYEVKINGERPHKLLPADELKKLAGVKRINQYEKVEAYLNTPEGRKWAIETTHVNDF